MTRPTAAPAVWPYAHKTVAEVDAEQEKLRAWLKQCLAQRGAYRRREK